MTELDIRLTRYGSRVATELISATLADLSKRYGGDGDTTPIQPGEFDPPLGGFFVAYVVQPGPKGRVEAVYPRIIYKDGTSIPVGAVYMDGKPRTAFFDAASPEARLYSDFLRPRDWAGEGDGDTAVLPA